MLSLPPEWLDKIVKTAGPPVGLVLLHSEIMSKIRRSFTRAESAPKTVILSFRKPFATAALRCVASIMARATPLSPSLLRKWRLNYLSKGKEGLKDSYTRVDPQLQTLEDENERLKRIVAKQALELEIKSEC